MSLPTLPFTLYPKKLRLLGLLLMSLAFTAAGVWMIREGRGSGWFCAVFFGVCCVVFFAQLFPGSSYLTVSKDGIEFASLFRSTSIRWQDISEIGTYTIRQIGVPVTTLVGFDFAADYDRGRAGRTLSKAVAGFEGGLPDNYGLRPEELAELLAAVREECLQAESDGHG